MRKQIFRLGLPLLAVTALLVVGLGTAGATTATLKNISQPYLYGEPVIGNHLSVGHGTWKGTQPITYTAQFLRCNSAGAACKVISSAWRYLLVSADVNKIVEARVTAKNAAGKKTVYSNAFTVTGKMPKNTVAPKLSGTGVVGNVLTVSNGTWTGFSPFTFTYLFLSCLGSSSCTYVAGGSPNPNQITLDSTESGQSIKVKVIGQNSFGASTAFSNLVAVQ